MATAATTEAGRERIAAILADAVTARVAAAARAVVRGRAGHYDATTS
jgi:hypothetical protein